MARGGIDVYPLHMVGGNGPAVGQAENTDQLPGALAQGSFLITALHLRYDHGGEHSDEHQHDHQFQEGESPATAI